MAYKKKSTVSHYKTDQTIDKTKEIELDSCVKFVVSNWEDWDSHWSNKMSEFEDYYNRWIGKPPKRDEEWQSNFNKKLSWQAEKALVARFHTALFPTSAPIEYDATETVDELQGILGKSIVAHWFKVGKFSVEFLRSMKSAAIYGTGLFEDDWYVRKEKVFEKKEEMIDDFRPSVDGDTGKFVLDEDGNVVNQKVGSRKKLSEKNKMEIVEDRYRVRKANVFAWRVHPKKLNDEDNFPVIKQEFISYDDLVKMEQEFIKYGVTNGFENMDKIKEDNFTAKDGDIDRHFKDGSGKKDKKNKDIEILSYWGLYSDSEAKESEPSWIMVVNRKFKLRLSKNPFWHKRPPLFHIKWTEDEKPSYYGIGLVQIGRDAEDRANTVVNIRTDERRKNIKGGGWYNALDKKIKKIHLHNNVPGLYKPCSDVTNAVRLDIPVPSTPDDYKEEEISVNDHREITGATTSLLPVADERKQHDTLGGMQLLVGQAAARLKPDLMMMEMQGIRMMANRAFLLSRQFYTQSKMIELMASQEERNKHNIDKMYELTPGEIVGKMNFYCTGLSESIDKAQNIDKLLKYAEVTGKIPAMQAITNYQNIAKRIALWLGFEDIEDFVEMNPDNPYQPPQPQPQPMGLPGQPPGMPGGMPPGIPQGLPPGMPPPGIPQGIPQLPIPQGVPLPPQGVPQGVPQGMPQSPGGLPPEILQMIVQSILKGRQ